MAQPYAADFAADAPPLPVGLRGQPLLALLRRALEEKKLTPSRARRMLMLDAAVPLPFGDLGSAAAPAADPAARIVRSANEYLARCKPGLVAGSPERAEEGTWRVPIMVGGVGGHDPTPRGVLVINALGAVVRDEAKPAP